MRTVTVDLAHAPYKIQIGSGLLASLQPVVDAMPAKRAVIVTNETIAPLYLEQVASGLKVLGVSVLEVVLPDGEAFKTWDVLSTLFDQLMLHRCERKTTLIALGGGVIGDMTGFAAAVYQRGVPFIQVPTTLLAQVDSSVGGKTAINHPMGKNMLGAFYQPKLVVADLSTLDTLPAREFSAGLAEVIKYGLIDDLPFFHWLEANMPKLLARDPEALAYAVERCCQNKARIVAADEKEEGVRALLNLGHTFGHAIEAGLGFGVWLHGEAVAVGMSLAARASHHLGHLQADEVRRIDQLIRSAGLPVEAPSLGLERWLALMAQDKKVDAGEIRFVLMRKLGESYIGALPASVLSDLLS